MHVEEWVIVPAGYANEGVGYCARYAWRSGLLCPLVEEWVTVPLVVMRSGLLLPLAMRGGVGYCARWLCS